MSSPHETPLDMGEIERALDANRLGGMPEVVELLIAEERIETYEALTRALNNAANYNSVGNFEIIATDIPRAQSIMGKHPDNPNPTRMVVVAAAHIIPEMMPVIEIAREKTEEKLGEDEEEPGADPKPDATMAA